MTPLFRYKEQDNDVAVFGKILHNEIDEEFRYVQKQLKETVADLLRVYLKGKFPQKTDDTINELLKQRLQVPYCTALHCTVQTSGDRGLCPHTCDGITMHLLTPYSHPPTLPLLLRALCTKRSGWISSSTCTTTATRWPSSSW